LAEPSFLEPAQTGVLQPPKFMVWGTPVVWNGETKGAVTIDLDTFAFGLWAHWEHQRAEPGLVQLVWFRHREISQGIQVSPTKQSKVFSLGVCVQDDEGGCANFQLIIRKRRLQALQATNIDVTRRAFDFVLELAQRTGAINCPTGVLTVDLGDVERVATCITSFDTGFSECEYRGIDRLKLRRAVEAQPVWTFGQQVVQLCIKEQRCWGVPLLIKMSCGDPFNVEVHKSGIVQLKGVKKRSLHDAYTFTSGLLAELYPDICTAPGVLTPTRKNRKRRSPEVA